VSYGKSPFCLAAGSASAARRPETGPRAGKTLKLLVGPYRVEADR
jgi:hypothetical protein